MREEKRNKLMFALLELVNRPDYMEVIREVEVIEIRWNPEKDKAEVSFTEKKGPY